MTKSARLLQWFGSNTENAAAVGILLKGCRFVGIPFAGGMSEVPFIDAKQILANDKHRHLINLCQCIAQDDTRSWLVEQSDAMPYHPDILQSAQEKAAGWDWTSGPSAEAALWYFVTVWMGRGGKAGTTGEFKGALPIRWNANGGGSNRRYRTAIEALEEWGRTFRRCEFTCMDGLDFVTRFPDADGSGLYVDAPWPDAGEEYQHRFSDNQQKTLAEMLAGYQKTRVVIRFGEHSLIRELYGDGWEWIGGESRDQANAVKQEWLIGRNLG